jgi:exodeoxyribonuclease V gamma subunit
LNELIRFFKNPVKEYYSKALGINYREEDLLLKETELFELENGLPQWSLKNELLQTDPDKIDALKKRYIKTGKLPLKNMADVEVNNIEQSIHPFREIFNKCRENEEPGNLNIEVAINGSILKGTLTNIFGEKIIFTSLSKKEYKNLIEAAILYLAAVAAGNNVTVHFISFNKLSVFDGLKIPQKIAIDYLAELVKIYKKGHEKMIAFYPDLEINSEEISALNFTAFSKKVDKAIERGDECIQLEYRNGFFKDEQIFEEFKENFDFILKPVETIFPDYYKK